MVFANELTRMVSGHPELPYQGKRCYEYMLGADGLCGYCPMNQMGDEAEKTVEVDDGDHVFQLKARYATWNGRRVFIEYGRDVTDIERLAGASPPLPAPHRGRGRACALQWQHERDRDST